jgi:hypothetical protein
VSTLSNTSGFSGGYVVSSTSAGLSTYNRATNYAYTSGANILFDSISTDASITYNSGTGVFVTTFAGIYLLKMYIGVTGMATGQSVHSNLSVGLASALTMGYYSGNCAQTGGILTCPFIADVNLAAGETFSFSLTLLAPTTITILGSTEITSSIYYLGA